MARMRRHERCIYGGRMQPSVISLVDRVLIGRGEACDVILDSSLTPQMISRSHAVVTVEDESCMIEDQGSLNGVHINGTRISSKQALKHGDVVTFGVPSPQPEFDYIFEMRS